MSLYRTLCVLLIFFSLCPGYTISLIRRRPDLDGLLSNGLFEKTPLESKMNGRQIIGEDDLPDWRISGYLELINSNEAPPGGFNFSFPRGAHAVRLGNSGSISQSVEVKPGLVYSLTFGATKSCAQDMSIKVSVSGLSDNIPIQTIFSSNGGDSYAWAFKAMSDVVIVTLQNPDLSLDRTCGPLVNVVAIKEILPTRREPLPFLRVNLVKNGRFEIGPYMFTKYSTGVLIPAKSQEDSISPLREWFVESPMPVKYITNSKFQFPTRLHAVELMGGRESAISQVIISAVGQTYFLGFWVGDAHNDCHGSMMVKAFAGNESFNVSFVSKGEGDYETENIFSFVAVSDRTKLTFYSVFNHTKLHDSGDLCGPVLDNVVVRRA